MSNVEVVIATRNRPGPLVACLEALANQVGASFGVVVVDDASDVPVESVIPGVLRERLDLRVLRQPRQSGPAAARNRGVETSGAALIVFVDDDVRAAPDLVRRHVEAVRDAQQPLATFGPLAIPADWRPEPWTLWEAQQLAIEYERMSTGTRAACWRDFATGNACVTSADFRSVGGFDERFTRAEDAELALRLAKAGTRFAFLPDAVGWHYAHRSLASWLAIPGQYGVMHAEMDRLHPDLGWLETVRREQAQRHPLLRAARAALCRPVARPLATRGAVAMARVLMQLRRRLALNALSLAYDLEYNAALGRAGADCSPASSEGEPVPPGGPTTGGGTR